MSDVREEFEPRGRCEPLGRRSEILREAAEALGRPRPEPEWLRVVAQSLEQEISGWIRFALLLPSQPDRAELVRFDPSSEDDTPSLHLAVRDSHLSETLRRTEGLYLPCLEPPLPFGSVRELHAEGARSFASLPLRWMDETIGALDVARAAVDGFSPEDLRFLEHLCLLLSSSLVHQRARRRGAEALRRTRTILDNARDGFVLVTLEGRIAMHSQSLAQWVSPASEGVRVWDWFESRAPDFAETLEVGWNALQDGFLPVEVALRQLPRTLLLGPRHLEFDYRSAGSSDEGLEVVIIVRDVSDRPEREAEQELLAALRHHARDPAGFGAFVRETNKLMHRVQRGEATPLEIHTAKGNVAVVGAASVSRALHALEVANETGSLDLALARATGAWERFKGRLTQVADLDRGPGVLITLEEYVDFRAKVRSRAPELLDDMQAWPFELLDARLEKLAEGALQVARRLGKPAPRIELDGERIRLDPDRYGPLWMALIHPIRNAVDHGIEAPEVRRAAGKAEQGLLRIQGRLNEGGSTLVLSIEDDGAGMDWRMIAEAVGKLDLQDPVEGGDLKMALFLHPVSTKSEATDISGQGLGLSALHRVVQDLHGTIQIESQPGKGTRVRALVPLHNPSERASPPNPLASGVDAVRRHYAAVGRRLTQVKEKAYVQAQDAARGLEAILESETLEEAREGAAALIMQLQRSDIQGQELSNVGDAIALLADFLGDGPRPLERLHELPSALDRLLPRQDLDARDIPEPRRGPAIDLFIGASQAPDRREKT